LWDLLQLGAGNYGFLCGSGKNGENNR